MLLASIKSTSDFQNLLSLYLSGCLRQVLLYKNKNLLIIAIFHSIPYNHQPLCVISSFFFLEGGGGESPVAQW